MNIDNAILVVLVALFLVSGYIAYAVHGMAQIMAGYWKRTSIVHDAADDGLEEDPFFEAAKAAVLQAGACSTSLLQRKLRIGYGRAARLADLLAEEGVIEWHAKPSPGRWVVAQARQTPARKEASTPTA